MLTGTLPPASNRADWIDCVEIRDTEADDEDDALIDLSDCSIVLAIYDEDYMKRADASTDDGDIVIVDAGVFQFTFPRSVMGTLDAGTYKVGCTISRDDETVQLLIGDLPVVDGFVPL